jgi:hypothetical protein
MGADGVCLTKQGGRVTEQNRLVRKCGNCACSTQTSESRPTAGGSIPRRSHSMIGWGPFGIGEIQLHVSADSSAEDCWRGPDRPSGLPSLVPCWGDGVPHRHRIQTVACNTYDTYKPYI